MDSGCGAVVARLASRALCLCNGQFAVYSVPGRSKASVSELNTLSADLTSAVRRDGNVLTGLVVGVTAILGCVAAGGVSGCWLPACCYRRARHHTAFDVPMLCCCFRLRGLFA